MIRHIFKNFAAFTARFLSVYDHFRKLCIKGLKLHHCIFQETNKILKVDGALLRRKSHASFTFNSNKHYFCHRLDCCNYLLHLIGTLMRKSFIGYKA